MSDAEVQELVVRTHPPGERYAVDMSLHSGLRALTRWSGINVQAELQMKTGSPVLGPGFMHSTTPMPQQPQLQRTTLQRAQARRSGLPKLAPGHSNSDLGFSTTSPLAHPTPSSHGSSPSQMSMRSPAIQQMGMTSPASAVLGQPQAQPYQSFAGSSQQQPSQAFYQPQQHATNAPRYRQHRATASSTYQGSTSGISNMSPGLPYPGSSGGSAPPSASAFYPSPFQKHFEQLGKSTSVLSADLCLFSTDG